MNLTKSTWVIAGLLTVVSSFSFASVPNQLIKCANIKNDQQRLKCYDAIALTFNKNNAVVADLSEQTEQAQSDKTTPLPVNNEIANKNNSEPQKPALKEEDETKSKFGMEFANQDEKIESFLVGNFSSWKKGMKLKLKNGQIWKVINARSGYRRMTNPAITISRGFFGSFDAKVEGLNAKAKVKRIK